MEDFPLGSSESLSWDPGNDLAATSTQSTFSSSIGSPHVCGIEPRERTLSVGTLYSIPSIDTVSSVVSLKESQVVKHKKEAKSEAQRDVIALASIAANLIPSKSLRSGSTQVMECKSNTCRESDPWGSNNTEDSFDMLRAVSIGAMISSEKKKRRKTFDPLRIFGSKEHGKTTASTVDDSPIATPLGNSPALENGHLRKQTRVLEESPLATPLDESISLEDGQSWIPLRDNGTYTPLRLLGGTKSESGNSPASGFSTPESASSSQTVVSDNIEDTWSRDYSSIVQRLSESKLSKADKSELCGLLSKLNVSFIKVSVARGKAEATAQSLKEMSVSRNLHDCRKLPAASQDENAAISQQKSASRNIIKSFAAALGANAGVKGKEAVLVRGAESDKSEEIEKKLKASVHPGEEGWHVVSVRRQGKNAVRVELPSPNSADKLMKHPGLQGAGLTANPLPLRNPLIAVYGVPRTASDVQFVNYMHSQNFSSWDKDDFLRRVKISHKIGKRDAELASIVVEVTPDIRSEILKRGYLFVDWAKCRAQDYTKVTRCFKCQLLGHLAKSCQAESPTCGHCAQNGHQFVDCTNKDGPAVCAVCKAAGRDDKHNIRSQDCPTYLRALRYKMNFINYGQETSSSPQEKVAEPIAGDGSGEPKGTSSPNCSSGESKNGQTKLK